MNDGSRPSVLYKYRALRPESARRFAEAIFAQRELYFALATQLNDPLDCRVQMSLAASDSDLFAAVDEGRATPEMANIIRQARTDRKIAAALIEVQRDLRVELVRGLAVLSLSSDCSSPRMWEHYADGHRGICIGFDSCQDFFVDAKPVNYYSKLSTIEYYRHSFDECAALGVLSKTTDWAYEREWRMVGVSAVSRLIGYWPQALVEVIFGARCANDDLVRIRDLAISVNPHVRLFRAAFKRGKPEMFLERLD